jgi:serine/threonine-protein kinase HipA
LAPGLPLSPDELIDSGTARPVQWFFDNLLPEEATREALARDANLKWQDAFGLLACYGAESAGAITLLPDDEGEPAPGERPLADADLAARIAAMPRVSLVSQAPKKMSLAGAHQKLAVIARSDGSLAEAVGSAPSTHILKPDIPDAGYPHSVANEHFSMRLAQMMRLPVPPVQRRYVPAPIFLVERFDRDRREGQVHRLHSIDACQLLNLDRTFKYTAVSVEVMNDIASRCSDPAIARLRLFSWIVFNVLIGNADAHLKNLSFLVTRRGITLAPHYDLLAVAVYDTKAMREPARWPATNLAWPMANASRFEEIEYGTLLAAADALALRAATARRLIDFQLERILQSAKALLQELESEEENLSKGSAELAAIITSEKRIKRAIVHAVISVMVDRITRTRPSPPQATIHRAT